MLILSSAVAYFANDTGSAAAGPAFLYAMVGITYPTLLAVEQRSGEPTLARPERKRVRT
jgi:hypothetical protein